MTTAIMALMLAAAGAAEALPATNAASAAHAPGRLTPAEARAKRAKTEMRRWGGVVRKAGSAHGKVVFLNAQGRVPRAALGNALAVVEDRVHPEWALVDGRVERAWNPWPELKAAGADVGVALVDDAALPALLVAPEVGWAAVNVSALDDGCGEEKLAKRTRVEVLRAFALAGGAAFMQQDRIVMRGDITVPRDLDMVREENYGVDVAFALADGLPRHGVTPWRQTTYKKACQEGWAPPPTNEYQKAVWNKVHAIPDKPLKIEYDPKKDK